MKRYLTLEYEKADVLAAVAKVGDGGETLGKRLVALMIEDPRFVSDMGMGVYGVRFSRGDLPQPAAYRWRPSDGDYDWTYATIDGWPPLAPPGGYEQDLLYAVVQPPLPHWTPRRLRHLVEVASQAMHARRQPLTDAEKDIMVASALEVEFSTTGGEG